MLYMNCSSDILSVFEYIQCWYMLQSRVSFISFYTPPLFVLYPPKILSVYPSVCPSVRRPSVSDLFPDSNLSSFWPICFKPFIDIDIGEEWFGIANGLNLFINNRVMALDWCTYVFFLHIFRTNGWIFIQFCICIDKYKIHVVSNAHNFWSIFNIDLCYCPLIDSSILFLFNILWINLWISIKFCVCIDTYKI